MQRECPLCGVPGAMTDEDVFPMWLRRHLIRKGSGGGKAPPRVKTRICRVCNETLGVRFEVDAAEHLLPLVEREPRELDVAHQAKVAAWIAKTTFLMTFCRSDPTVRDHDLLRELIRSTMETGRPAGPTVVHIGCIEVGDDDETDGPKLEDPALDEAPRSAFFGVCRTGHLVWDMWTGREDLVLDFIERTDTDQSAFQRIWPLSGSSLMWPPPVPVTPDHIDALREAYVSTTWSDLPPPHHRVSNF
jgi:hypothetical protein